MSKKISTLAVGAKVRDPLSKYYGVPVGFQIADKNHAGYPANSTTLAAEKILCLKAFDAKESGGNSDRQNHADRGEAHNGRGRQRNRDRRLLPAVQAGSGPRL